MSGQDYAALALVAAVIIAQIARCWWLRRRRRGRNAACGTCDGC